MADLTDILIGIALIGLEYFALACLTLAYQLIVGIEPWPPKRRRGVAVRDGKWEITNG